MKAAHFSPIHQNSTKELHSNSLLFIENNFLEHLLDKEAKTDGHLAFVY